MVTQERTARRLVEVARGGGWHYVCRAEDIPPQNAGAVRVWAVDPAGNRRRLHHYVYHSPDGFQFGYGGSGPADLALAILAHALGEQPTPERLRTYAGGGGLLCVELHQDFKWAHIAPLRAEAPWTLAGTAVAAFVAHALEQRRLMEEQA